MENLFEYIKYKHLDGAAIDDMHKALGDTINALDELCGLIRKNFSNESCWRQNDLYNCEICGGIDNNSVKLLDITNNYDEFTALTKKFFESNHINVSFSEKQSIYTDAIDLWLSYFVLKIKFLKLDNVVFPAFFVEHWYLGRKIFNGFMNTLKIKKIYKILKYPHSRNAWYTTMNVNNKLKRSEITVGNGEPL